MDLEEAVTQVWSPTVKPLVQEAYRSYQTGAARATILLTWIAVFADLTNKISRLAEEGDGAAQDFVQRIDDASNNPLESRSIQEMQEAERTVLDVAFQLEITDAIGKRELTRLREDRHLCAHPSPRSLDEFYEPRVEAARAHLAAALELLLVHPPTRGRQALEVFRRHVQEATFASDADFVTATFFDRVRSGTRRSIVSLAVKHALLELEGPEPVGAIELADRMATCVRAFATRDRAIVREAIRSVTDRFALIEGSKQLRAAGRLGSLDVFWETLGAAITSRLSDLVRTLVLPGPFDELDPDLAALLSLVSSSDVRGRIDHLQERFDALASRHKALVIGKGPHPYFGSVLPGLMAEASSFRTAEFVGLQAAVPLGPMLTADQLHATLENWAENRQCRQAGGMLEIAVQFFYATRHLGNEGLAIWQDFVRQVQSMETDVDSSYRYSRLEDALQRA